MHGQAFLLVPKVVKKLYFSRRYTTSKVVSLSCEHPVLSGFTWIRGIPGNSWVCDISHHKRRRSVRDPFKNTSLHESILGSNFQNLESNPRCLARKSKRFNCTVASHCKKAQRFYNSIVIHIHFHPGQVPPSTILFTKDYITTMRECSLNCYRVMWLIENALPPKEAGVGPYFISWMDEEVFPMKTTELFF